MEKLLQNMNRSFVRKTGVFIKSTVVAFAMMAMPVSEASSQTPFKLQHYTGIFLEAPVYVAVHEGFFEKHGLNVELFGIMQGTTSIAALSNGSVDAIYHATSFAMSFNAKSPPDPAVLISNIYAAPIYDLIGRNEVMQACPDFGKPFPEPLKCLKGKRIGITALGSDNYNVMVSLMKAVDLTESDATLVATGGGALQANALRADQVDYILSVEPAATMIVDVLKVGDRLVDISADPLMAHWSGEGAFALKANVAANPEKFNAFAQAIADAIEFMQDPANDDKVAAAFEPHGKQDPELMKAMLNRNRSFFAATIDCEAYSNVSKWLVESGQVGAVNMPCEEFVAPGAKK